MKNKLNSVKLSFTVTALVLAVLSLVRFAKPNAFEISKLRQLDNPLITILTVLVIAAIAVIIAVAFIKKTKGEYASFGMILASMMMYLYSVIDAQQMLKFLYIPAIQKFFAKSDIHVDVTTLQSAKMLADAFNMIICAVCVILLAAVAVSVIRYIDNNDSKCNALNVTLSALIGVILAYPVWSMIVSENGYSFMFMVTSVIVGSVGIIGCIMSAVKAKS